MALNLTGNGVGANGFAPAAISALTLIDTNNEIITINLKLTGNSYLNLSDNGLTTFSTGALDSQTGALVAGAQGVLFLGPGPFGSTISDTINKGVSLDFSGLNSDNNISVFRGVDANADTYKLSDFGTNNSAAFEATKAQHLGIWDGTFFSANTVSFGSGANIIGDSPHISYPHPGAP